MQQVIPIAISLPDHINFEQIGNRAHLAFQRKNYSTAIKKLDILHWQANDWQTSCWNGNKWGSLTCKAFWKTSNSELSYLRTSKKLFDICDLILDSGVFSKNVIEAEIDFYKSLKQLQANVLRSKKDLLVKENITSRS